MTNRRDFLKKAGLFMGASAGLAALPPVGRLAELFVSNLVRKAQADTALDSNYIGLLLSGAPGRWIFDQILGPPSSMMANKQVANMFNTTGTDTYYTTRTYRGVEVPPLWMTSVNVSAGAKPLSNLLDHMITFRGYGTGVDGHPSNSVRQFAPVPSIGSITGFMADSSGALLKAVNYPAMETLTGYQAPNGSGLTSLFNQDFDPHIQSQVQGNNLFKSLLYPFIARSEFTSVEQLRAKYKSVVEVSQDVITRYQQGRVTGADAVFTDKQLAMKKLVDGIEDLDASWPEMFNRYHNILVTAFRDLSLPGLTNMPIVPTANNGNINTIYNVGNVQNVPSPGYDIREWVNSPTLTFRPMAQALALSEFLVTRGLGSAIEVALNPPYGMTGHFDALNGAFLTNQGASNFFDFNYDQHATGHMTAVFINTCLYRAVGAGILELTDKLKNAGVFNKTVIHLTAEFGRTAHMDGTGADHGFDAMVSSVFTGKNTSGPMVIGNIQKNGTLGMIDAGVYAGTFGWKAPTVTSSGTTLLTPTHVAASISTLLGFPHNPWENTASSLLSFDGGVLKKLASGEIV